MKSEELIYPISPPADRTSMSAQTSPLMENENMADEDEVVVYHTPQPLPSAIRRSRSPPKNENGDMICDHENCRDKSETFRRLCEWNKHMDRHERPYKCKELGCELSPGFTYSGGLLRHQREVHKMHLSTKQPLFCPVANCNRSSGQGFTRRENLEEHKRRRHVGEITEQQSKQIQAFGSDDLSTRSADNRSRKRKRLDSYSSSTNDNGDAGGGGEGFRPVQIESVMPGTDDDDRPLIQQLKAELATKDAYIRQLTVQIQHLRNVLGALPPTIYSVNHMTSPSTNLQLGPT